MTPASEIRTGRSLEQGFEVYWLRNDAVALAVVPALGAKIISLRNLISGHQWMYHPPTQMKLFPNRLGDPFASSTMTGWDECLPTIAPCLWKQRNLPDHGETWSVPWRVDLAALDRGVLQTSVTLAVSPFYFERRIELRRNEIHLHYTLKNLGIEPEQFLWAMHPLLPVQDDDELELSGEVRQQLAAEHWINGLKFKSGEPACAKIHAGPLDAGEAGVVNAVTRDRLRFVWDAKANNTLGLWLTRGGWHGHHHLVLEPMNGAPDPLSEAAKTGRCGVVPPGESLTWNVSLSVGSGF